MAEEETIFDLTSEDGIIRFIEYRGFAMLEAISRQDGKMAVRKLQEKMGYKRRSTAFWRHVSFLLDNGFLIMLPPNKLSITDRGMQILDLVSEAREIEAKTREEFDIKRQDAVVKRMVNIKEKLNALFGQTQREAEHK